MRHHLISILLYFLLCIVVTYPVILDPVHTLIGDSHSDIWAHIWGWSIYEPNSGPRFERTFGPRSGPKSGPRSGLVMLCRQRTEGIEKSIERLKIYPKSTQNDQTISRCFPVLSKTVYRVSCLRNSSTKKSYSQQEQSGLSKKSGVPSTPDNS